jgi:hypothetical protein
MARGNRITAASHAEPKAIPWNLKLEREGVVDVPLLERILKNKVGRRSSGYCLPRRGGACELIPAISCQQDITSRNATEIQQIIQRAGEGVVPQALPW